MSAQTLSEILELNRITGDYHLAIAVDPRLLKIRNYFEHSFADDIIRDEPGEAFKCRVYTQKPVARPCKLLISTYGIWTLLHLLKYTAQTFVSNGQIYPTR